MQRLTALLAVVVWVLLTGCEGGTSTGPEPIEFAPGTPPAGEGFAALYTPPVDVGPYPNDIYNRPGETLSVPEKITSPLAAALNTLDGFSTIAPISAPFNDAIDPASLVPFDPQAPSADADIFVFDATNQVPLSPETDYELRISDAAGTGGTILEIVPRVPLAAATTYGFVLTNGIRSMAGAPASADTVFGLVRDAHLAGVMTGNPDLDALLPAVGPLIDAAMGLFGVPGDSIVSAWSVSTQSIGDVLGYIEQNATAQPAALTPTGTDTADLGLGLPGIADLYVGFLEIPYYQDPDDPLGSFWINASMMPPTRSDPVPILQGGQIRIPLLASIPNAASGNTEPAGGWPVVILQHGVTANRSILVTMADAFAQAGFALVAIDLPLHGVTDVNSPFYQGPGNPFGTTERHFNLDNVGDVGELAPDGSIDNGWQIFNVQNPLNARDHGRQAVSDLIHLVRTVPTIDIDGDTAGDFDASTIHFISVSLGSIFSTAFLAVNEDFGAATMTSPGGPYSAFLYNPNAVAFGLPIRAALEAQGLAFGTRAYDNFVRDLQTVLDPVDPMNYAEVAAQNHPIHVIEVLGDTAVPPALTDALAALMGLADISETTMDPAGVRGIVRFTAGGHASIFDPSIDRDVTQEMQTQAVGFAASSGTAILIDNTDVVQ